MSSRREQQLSHSIMQNSRVVHENARSMATNFQGADFGRGTLAGSLEFGGGFNYSDVEEVPAAEKCIGQVVLDWEFVHDLDLHLLRVVDANAAPAKQDQDLDAFLDEGNNLRLRPGQTLESVVYYGSKILPAPSGGSIPQAVLQLDRNAAVHSHKPVENLYLTEALDAGIYVVAVHNFSQRRLEEGVVGHGREFSSFEDFQKRHPGYQLMEKALKDQENHAEDAESPQKQAIMRKVDQELNHGSQLVHQKCCSGNPWQGVHYGVTVYTYPTAAGGGGTRAHPQAATMEDLESKFQVEFFATSDCVFNPQEDRTGYNSATVLADVRTEDGKLALPNRAMAHVALIQVSKAGALTAQIVGCRILASVPFEGDPGEGGPRRLAEGGRHGMPQQAVQEPEARTRRTPSLSRPGSWRSPSTPVCSSCCQQ